MKRLIVFVILYSLLIILCPNAIAQWEGAQVQRLTYDGLPNHLLKLYIDDNDKLYLFYLEGVRDTITGFVYDYRILYKTKENGDTWSLPAEINTSTYIFGQNHKAGLWMDTKSRIIHLLNTNYTWTKLNYTNSTIPNWESVTMDSLIGQNAQFNSFEMSFDSLGNVHIAWHVDFDSIGAEWYRVMYANNSTGEWVKQQVSPPIFLGGMESGETIFDVQKNGIAHIVYYGGSWGLAYYARNDSLNGNNWHTDTIPKPQRPLYYYGVRTIKVDFNDTVHLITGGCIMEDCVSGEGLQRHFYFFKESEDSIWQGPEVIPDSTFLSLGGIEQLFISNEGVPYVSYGVNPGRVYFTDRKLGFWQEPYRLLDPANYYASDFFFVLDSQRKGQAVFAGSLPAFLGQDDSLEIFTLESSGNSVLDKSEDYNTNGFNLFQNYPNPFNATTIIRYSLNDPQHIHATLKLYNILGEEVRELVNARQTKGNYRVSWDGKDKSGKEAASGIYFYQLKAGNLRETKRLLLIK
jgi:hypothetical protein